MSLSCTGLGYKCFSSSLSRLGETLAVDVSLCSRVSCLCEQTQAGSWYAVLPPPHAKQTQPTSARLLTWLPARPRHARGICSAHDCKYGGLVCSHTFNHGDCMIHGQRSHDCEKPKYSSFTFFPFWITTKSIFELLFFLFREKSRCLV